MTASEAPDVRIGVVGAGFMGRQHIDFIRAAPGAALAAVADPAAVEGAFDCPTYPSAAAMLDAEDLDAVIIANPNPLHVDTAIECLEAGVAVLLEKPVAVDYAQSLRLVDAVARLHGRLLVGHHRRHHPAIARARAAIRDGEIGQVVGVSGLWSARKEDAYFTDTPWHREPRSGRDAHQRRARPRSASPSVRRGRRDPGDAELPRPRPRGRGHGVAEPQVRKRRGRELPRLRRRRLAVGLGPGHRGDARVPVRPGRRRLPTRRHARRAVGAQPREVLLRPVGLCRLALPAVAHLPPGRAAGVVPGCSSTTSSRSPEERRSRSSRPRMPRGRSRSSRRRRWPRAAARPSTWRGSARRRDGAH